MIFLVARFNFYCLACARAALSSVDEKSTVALGMTEDCVLKRHVMQSLQPVCMKAEYMERMYDTQWWRKRYPPPV